MVILQELHREGRGTLVRRTAHVLHPWHVLSVLVVNTQTAAKHRKQGIDLGSLGQDTHESEFSLLTGLVAPRSPGDCTVKFKRRWAHIVSMDLKPPSRCLTSGQRSRGQF